MHHTVLNRTFGYFFFQITHGQLPEALMV